MRRTSSSPNVGGRPRLSEVVLDASAVLAYLYREPGEPVVSAYAGGCAISAVNLDEVVAKLADRGQTREEIELDLEPLTMTVEPWTEARALRSGMLSPLTRRLGLSAGDRAALTLALDLDLPVLTTDRAWATVPLGATVVVIR